MLKNEIYEIMSPESVEYKNGVLNKHSGRSALKNKMTEWGIKINDELHSLFDKFKALCDQQKHMSMMRLCISKRFLS